MDFNTPSYKPTGDQLKRSGFLNNSVQDNLLVGEGKAVAGNAQPIGRIQIQEAFSKLERFRSGKAALDARIRREEEWWKIKQWELEGGGKNGADPQPSSAWTFNAIINKHADLMDSIPKATCLAREESDENSAKTITSIFPVILEGTDWEQVYSDNAYYFIKHGISCYRITWDNNLSQGIGDIRISDVDVLNLFWEPGIKKLQKSSDVFEVELVSVDNLKKKYPRFSESFSGGDNGVISKYLSDSDVDTSDKALVVNWYYKKRNMIGKEVLHYCKFSCGVCLYASENDERYSERGYYDHGRYPYELDVMYPIAGTCYGFGVIEAARNPQLAIDCLDASVLRYAKMKSTPRYWKKKDVTFNTKDFIDWSNHIIEVDGSIDEERLRPVQVENMDGFVTNVRNEKIAELKETVANRDVNSGGTGGGVTSGAAIATLQEAGNKVSRDLIAGSYRTIKKVFSVGIELMRQFYDEPRIFRIMGSGDVQYATFDNSALKVESTNAETGITEMIRVPLYDIEVIAEKKNPFSTLAQNETIVNLWNLGAFNPENAQSALIAVELMEFEGKEKVLSYIREGQTLYNVVQQQAAEIQQMQTVLMQVQGGAMSVAPGREMR